MIEPQKNDISNKKKTLFEYLKEKMLEVLNGKTNSSNNDNMQEETKREKFVRELKSNTMLQQISTQIHLKDENEIEK